MCAVSAVGQYFANTITYRYPGIVDQVYPSIATGFPYVAVQNPVTQEQFEQLRQEVLELKQLLLAAKAFDEKTGQHECSQEEKVELLRQVATMVGVDLKDIFPDDNDQSNDDQGRIHPV